MNSNFTFRISDFNFIKRTLESNTRNILTSYVNWAIRYICRKAYLTWTISIWTFSTVLNGQWLSLTHLNHT